MSQGQSHHTMDTSRPQYSNLHLDEARFLDRRKTQELGCTMTSTVRDWLAYFAAVLQSFQSSQGNTRRAAGSATENTVVHHTTMGSDWELLSEFDVPCELEDTPEWMRSAEMVRCTGAGMDCTLDCLLSFDLQTRESAEWGIQRVKRRE